MSQSQLPAEHRDRTICVLGLGFVGLTLAAVMTDVGFDVIGVEIRPEVRELLSSGAAHFHEPGLNENVRRGLLSGRLSVSAEIPENSTATVYIITVGTPLGADGRVNLDSVRRIARQIAAALKPDDLVILRSTVKIGTTRNVVAPILHEAGIRFEIAFCPERTVEGQALAELRYLPQIIGSDERGVANRAAQLFSFLTPTVIRVSSLETAEMIKLIDNAKRDVMFGYANEVARMCDGMGISAAEVIRSGRFGYSRTDLPMPGPVGGPCLSKDSHILAESMEQFGISPEITVSARAVNERQPAEIATFLKQECGSARGFPDDPKIALLGIAFKGHPPTDDVRGTTATAVFEALGRAFPKARFVAYDPVVQPDSLRELGLEPVDSLDMAFEGAHLVLILNSHGVFGSMPIEVLADSMAKPGLIYDCWNNFVERPIRLASETRYVALGSHGRPILG